MKTNLETSSCWYKDGFEEAIRRVKKLFDECWNKDDFDYYTFKQKLQEMK
jgi:hypothetical protein